MSPKVVKITSRRSAIEIASSWRPIGITQTGQPGPVDQLDLVGQQVLDAVLVDGVGVAAAHLHELVVAIGLHQAGDLLGEALRQVARAVLVDEAHAAVARPDCGHGRPPIASRSRW